MQHFYDGQIRRYITQTIRALSNFVVKYGDGSLHQVPVMYGDADRQVASIIRQNSENVVNSVPRISVYVKSLALDRERLADQSFVGKVHIRERDIEIDNTPGSPTYGQPVYNQAQGKNYTIERLMPTPFKLTMNCDIWASSTDQKLQILEQILVLFNPSLELQTTDNYIDWTSLSVLNLNDINWSSKQVPVGNDTPIDIATLTLDTPVWINPPVKVKHLGVITKIITSIHSSSATSDTYIAGLGMDTMGATTTLGDIMTQDTVTINGYQLQVYNNQAILLGSHESVVPAEPTLDIPVRQGTALSWAQLFAQTPGKYVAGSSQLYLQQKNGTQVVGTIAINSLDDTILQVNWNPDTLVRNTGIDSAGNIEDKDLSYNPSTSYRPNSPGTFDAIINPLTYNPEDHAPTTGRRYLVIEDVGVNTPAWGNLVAVANDIIEYDGTAWHVIFAAAQDQDTMVWQTNIYTGVQYLWDGVQWKKSFEGEYGATEWNIVL